METVKMTELLSEAVNKPGIVSKAYSSFHRFSLLNQMAAHFQCLERGIQPGPLATFPAWKDKGRHVCKGQKAITLCMPVSGKYTEENKDTGESEEHRYTRFIWKANWFVLSQTDGEAYAPEIPDTTWNKAAATKALEIKEVPFDMIDGNCQGYSFKRSFALNPLAKEPLKTTLHELAHIELGHTLEGMLSDSEERTPRDIRELEAESVAYIIGSIIGLTDEALTESRGYIQSWYKSNKVPEKSAQKIFAVASKILKAGQPT
jgi:hypothetical protein